MAPANSSRASEETDDWVLEVGDEVEGGYRVAERIDSGAFGEVYAAETADRGVRVALKLLRTDSEERDPRALARMRQEAEILRALDHPNLVDVEGFGSSDYGEYLAMEFLEGPTLEEVIEQRETEPDSERVRDVVVQILSALEAMHAEDVQHRDLKPENIVLTGPRRDPTVKLVDFGIAKADQFLDSDHEEGFTLVETRDQSFVGTPRYASPEQALGDPVGPASDLFSLGLVVLEWLSGESPIDSEDQQVIVSRMIKPEPFDVSGAPERWRDWLSKMIAKQPEDRYASATESREALPAVGETDEIDRNEASRATDRRASPRESVGTPGDPEEPTVVETSEAGGDESTRDVDGETPPPATRDAKPPDLDAWGSGVPDVATGEPGSEPSDEGSVQSEDAGEAEAERNDAPQEADREANHRGAERRARSPRASTSTAADRSAPRIEQQNAESSWWLTLVTGLLFFGALALFVATLFGWAG